MVEVKELLQEDYTLAKDIYCDSFEKENTESFLPILGKVIGIYLDDSLIGFCQIDYLNDFFENKKRAYINSFCIQSKYRNRGYGDRLLKECISLLVHEGVDYINMTSNSSRKIAHRLYRNNNFEIVDTCIFKRNLL